MNAKNITIDRDAHDKVKGFRFQRLRAVGLMLKAITENKSSYIYCAIEDIGDLHIRTASNIDVADYIEEDKDYAKGTGFSFNSIQVLKTLVNFIDAWHKFDLSRALYFGFCTTAVITKEKSSTRSRRVGVEFPDIALLEVLAGKEPPNKEVLSVIKAIMIDIYQEEYSNHNKNGYIDSIKHWDDSTWREFFKRISWYFGECDEKKLESELKEALKGCPFYNNQLRGKEGHIISILVDEFDKKQDLPDFAERFVHSAEILLVAKQVEAGEYRLSDPAWKMWEDLPPSDNRNIVDKVRSVTTTFNDKVLSSWCRIAALSRYEQDSLKHDKSIMSLRYRVFEKCYEKLLTIVQKRNNIGQEQIEQCVEELVTIAFEHIEKLSQDYKYALRSQPAIRGIILELVDSCFLSFDEKGEMN